MKTGFSVCSFPCKKTTQGKPCFHYRDGFAVYSSKSRVTNVTIYFFFLQIKKESTITRTITFDLELNSKVIDFWINFAILVHFDKRPLFVKSLRSMVGLQYSKKSTIFGELHKAFSSFFSIKLSLTKIDPRKLPRPKGLTPKSLTPKACPPRLTPKVGPSRLAHQG